MNNEPEKNNIMEMISSMNKKTLGIIIGAAVGVVILVILLVPRNSTKDDDPEIIPETPIPVEDYSKYGDSDIENVVTNSGDKDEPWQELNDDDYSIKIAVMETGWSGQYMEDGSDEKVNDVLAVKFTNAGTQDILFAEYVFGIGDTPISFKVSNLPVGQSCIVLEGSRHKYNKTESMKLITRVVAQVEEIPFARDSILVVDNSDNTISIMNLTDKSIPSARVFYKTFDRDENAYIGGTSYAAKTGKIPAGGSFTATPAHFQSGVSVILGTEVYKDK